MEKFTIGEDGKQDGKQDGKKVQKNVKNYRKLLTYRIASLQMQLKILFSRVSLLNKLHKSCN
jgi:uncharacterized protein involved in exopolysaccharide biosynthesis